MLCFIVPTQAQVDTSMKYSDFLNDCRNFTRNPQEEIWVVSFWASFNKESLYLIPSIIETSDRFKNKPVRFIWISTDVRRGSWEGVLNRYNMPGEQLWLPEQDDYNFLKLAFQHNKLPAIFVVEQTGQIRRVKIGDLNALVDALSKDLPAEPYYKDESLAQSNGRDEGGSGLDEFDNMQDGWVAHTVRRGDTLFGISKKYAVSVPEIKKINKLKSSRIDIGQVLKIKQR